MRSCNFSRKKIKRINTVARHVLLHNYVWHYVTFQAQAFQLFWGEKSELRRFQDGSICEAVVWPAKNIADRRQIVGKIVKLILNRYVKLWLFCYPRLFLWFICVSFHVSVCSAHLCLYDNFCPSVYQINPPNLKDSCNLACFQMVLHIQLPWPSWLNSLRPSDAYMRRSSNHHWFR